ncbi:hypothetical protein HMPREF0973_01431 [Prevotella veroralis F0319]|uniref:Uncharacterized protein n=1 Tax=Prevotella veroralis F0319 TaxID=649761 RepID=C9MP93_9BACT|nr:hypothetical protein HMPREF0973_01431 [Prevotella veroralis F0319]
MADRRGRLSLLYGVTSNRTNNLSTRQPVPLSTLSNNLSTR